MCDLHHYCALYPLLEQLASRGIYAAYAARSVISVGGTATGAIKLSPAVLAFPAGICVAGAELASYCLVCNAVPYVAQLELFLAYELVAGIQIL